MDLTATFAENPLRPAVWQAATRGARRPAAAIGGGSRAAKGWSRSAMTAPASPSIAKGRATASCSIRTRSPTGR